MARNIYFSDKVKSEQNLYEDLIIESLKMYGQDVYYIPRTLVNVDKIFGDDIPSKFSSAYKLEMYIDNVDGFAGQGDLFSKFGIEIRDQATFIVARKRWAQTVSSYSNDIQGDLPLQGDLIYLPLTKSIFQIMHVERESPFYQLSQIPLVRLECELFEYNDEDMATGIPEIDKIETLGYEVKLTLDVDSDTTEIQLGEIMTQTLSDGTTISGEVSAWDRSTQILSLIHVGASDGDYHIFSVGGDLVSERTSATRVIRAVNEDLGDHGYQNDYFDSDVSNFIDFTESNPFGDLT
jgi:hypothetical protein